MSLRPLIALLIAIPVAIVATPSEPASVNNTAYLYAGPGYNYAQLLTVPGGASVGLGYCQGPWCQASYGGKNGWINRSFVAGAVAGDSGRCRGGPSRCNDKEGPSFGSFGLSLAVGAARNRRGGGGQVFNQASIGGNLCTIDPVPR